MQHVRVKPKKSKRYYFSLTFFQGNLKVRFFVAAWSIPFPFENFGENGIIVIGFHGSYCVKQFQTLKSIQLATGHTFPISTTLSILRSVEVLCVMLNVNRLLPKVSPHLLSEHPKAFLLDRAWNDHMDRSHFFPRQAKDKRWQCPESSLGSDGLPAQIQLWGRRRRKRVV